MSAPVDDRLPRISDAESLRDNIPGERLVKLEGVAEVADCSVVIIATESTAQRIDPGKWPDCCHLLTKLCVLSRQPKSMARIYLKEGAELPPIRLFFDGYADCDVVLKDGNIFPEEQATVLKQAMEDLIRETEHALSKLAGSTILVTVVSEWRVVAQENPNCRPRAEN